jgi:hypothetical protein
MVNVVVATYVPLAWIWLDPLAARKYNVVATPLGLLADVRSATFFADIDNPSQHVWAVEFVPVLQAEALLRNLWSASVPCEEKAKPDAVAAMPKVKSGAEPAGE